MNFVLDNSVVMRWFFGDGDKSDLGYSLAVLDALGRSQAIVPTIWSLEVANVIARAEAKGLVLEARSAEFLEMLGGLDIVEDHLGGSSVLSRVLDTARRYFLPAYDAAYIELALRTGLPLATLDVELKMAAQQSGIATLLV